MTEEELCKAAMSEKYPDTERVYDWLAWYKLRDVYRDFKSGRITKETGELTKGSVLRSRQKQIDTEEMHWRAEKHLAEFWKQINEAATAYMKDPTIEHADRFVEAVYGASRLKVPETDVRAVVKPARQETKKPAT